MHTKKATVKQFVDILVRELVGRVRFISISTVAHCWRLDWNFSVWDTGPNYTKILLMSSDHIPIRLFFLRTTDNVLNFSFKASAERISIFGFFSGLHRICPEQVHIRCSFFPSIFIFILFDKIVNVIKLYIPESFVWRFDCWRICNFNDTEIRQFISGGFFQFKFISR